MPKQSDYSVGDIVFWATVSAAGEYTVIGHPKGQRHVLVFAGGGEVDARTAGRLADAIQRALGNIGSATYRSSQACWKATGRAAGCSLAMADYPHQFLGGPPITCEADHFIHCPACGTWIDCRNLGELLAHEDWCTRNGNRTPMRPNHQLIKDNATPMARTCQGIGTTAKCEEPFHCLVR